MTNYANYYLTITCFISFFLIFFAVLLHTYYHEDIKHRKVGGIHFIKLGKVNVSISKSKKA